MVQLNRLGPVVAVEPAGEGQPVGPGVRGIAGAELLPIREPDPSLAVNSDLWVGVSRGLLVQNVLVAPVRGLRERDFGSRQFGGRPHQLAVHEAGNSDRAA